MRSFFFAPESPRLLALVRIVLGLALLGDALVHWRYAIELYSTFGPAIPIFVRRMEEPPDNSVPSQSDAAAPAALVEPILPIPIPSPRLGVVAHTLLIFSLASMVLGWHTRASLIAVLILTLWLAPLDLPCTFGKHLVIALHLVFLLGFSHCGEVWSVDAWRMRDQREYCRLSSACPRRLMQILICSVYVGAVVTKIKTATYANGDLVTFSLLDDHWGGSRIGMWLTALRHVPLLLSWAMLLYEILFPVLVWVPRCRLPMLMTAFAVHACLGWLLSLGPFTPIMFAALLSFVEERDLRWVGNCLALWRMGIPARPSISRRTSSVGLHLLAAALFVAAGYAIQRSNDWYGVFGRRTLPSLQETSEAEVGDMLAQRPLAYEDYFHRIDLGNRVGGNQVFGAPDRFRIGQRAYVLSQMPVPHPAVELEGLLIAPDGRECTRFRHQFSAGFTYAVNGFELTPELAPGTYRVILQAEGFVVAERRFVLQP